MSLHYSLQTTFVFFEKTTIIFLEYNLKIVFERKCKLKRQAFSEYYIIDYRIQRLAEFFGGGTNEPFLAV